MLAVSIRSTALTEIRRHARRDYPLECCGLLSGNHQVIERVTTATNQRNSPTAFAIPPEELLAYFKALRGRSEQFLGIYHSHPDGPPVPSERDVREFFYPGASYWIVGADLEICCYRWRDHCFQACPFQTVD